MVKKILIIVILLPLMLLVFAPKDELFFLFESKLDKYGIKIANSSMHTNPIGLRVEHPSIYFKGAKVAEIDNLSIWTVLVYANANIDAIKFDASLKTFVPESIKNISAVYNIVKPMQVLLSIDDGKYIGNGEIDLKSRKIRFHFDKIPAKSPFAKYLKSNKGGWDYERNY